jgi:hypothetical protein
MNPVEQLQNFALQISSRLSEGEQRYFEHIITSVKYHIDVLGKCKENENV